MKVVTKMGASQVPSLWLGHCAQNPQGCWAPPERKRNGTLMSAGMWEQEIIKTSERDRQMISLPMGTLWSKI